MNHTMKKIFTLIISVAAICASLASCDAILDQESPSTFGDQIVFSNYDLTEYNIFGVLHSFGETNNYRGRFLPWYGFNTDIEWYNGTYKPGDGRYDIAAYNIASNNSQLNLSNGPYNMMYSGIERSNLIIEGLRNYGNTDTDAGMAYLLGETLTLRAMIYYDLIKAWGDVPARFSSVNGESIYVKKANRDVIFKQILSDLEEAIGYLPYPNTTKAVQTNDRVNKVFAEGLYARIALAASGYALRPDDGGEGTGDLGTVRLSNDPELSKSNLYPKALAFLKDAINNGGCSLTSDYEAYWKRQSNLSNLPFDGETLYVIPFSDNRGRWNFTFAVKANGASINGYTIASRGGDAGPVPTMWFEYDADDQRRDVTCVNYSWGKNGPEVAGIGSWYFGKYRFEWMTSQPYTGGNDDGVKPVVMRYSDVLLMAAEIENELNGPAGAKQYLLPVRERAFAGHEDKAEEYVAAISSKEAMFDAIVKERALEFCGEFLRKGDLIRWNMLKSKMDETIGKMMDLRDLSGEYSYLTGNIWHLLSDDEQSLRIYGLGKGETAAPDASWEVEEGYVTKYDDAKKTGFFAEKIQGLYYVNPDSRQFWPIFDDTISNSQGNLVNDYGY